jgi:hypothetical protein
LVLLVGPAGSGKTATLNETASLHGWPRLNVNLLLAERLIDFSQKQRAVRVAGVLEDLIQESSADVVLLDNLEILFAIELAQDPLRLLQSLSRNRAVIAAWPGTFDGQTLLYAEPSHREFRKYSNPDAVVILAVNEALSGPGTAFEESR